MFSIIPDKHHARFGIFNHELITPTPDSLLKLNIMKPSLSQYLNQHHTDLVEFCSHLLQIPSVNGVHDEVHVAQAIAAQARQLGLHAEIVGDNPRRPNVIVSTAPSGPIGLLLLGHLDTVPPGDESRWAYPPYSGTIANNCLYGRGAVDTKGGMAAALYALAALAHTPEGLRFGRAQFIGVPDEESGATGTLGIKWLAANGLLSGLGAIYAYSGSEIVLGHRGLLRYRLICTGEAIHTGMAAWQNGEAGANAVTAMAELLLELERIATPFSPQPYFDHYRTVFTPGTFISGGISINVVPNHCEALLDIRITPEFTRERVENLLQDCIGRIHRRGIKFDYELLNYAPAAISDETAPIFSIVEQVIQTIKGVVPERVVAGPANEGYLLIEHGIPTICGLGPTGNGAHSIDEYVELTGLLDAALIFALAAQQLDLFLKG
ncbi:MAG TPA: M20/M25/M40 family metallo-hydrolase [Phototrophicaceae bacterium]|nr:M20/M25/M40 family metallo-hydrolase [Phototrophicaceae bacterium]